MRETVIETALRDRVRAMGCLCWKFTSPGTGGVPDRIILMPNGRVCFVETKAPGKRERALQVLRQDQMRRLGCVVFSSVDSLQKIEEVCDYIRKEIT